MEFELKVIDSHSLFSEELTKQVYEFDKIYFDYPWERKSFNDLFLQPHLIVIASLPNKDLVGMLLMSINFEDSFSHLLKIVTRPDFLNSGIGSSMMKGAIEWCENKGITKVYLEVESTNNKAISLYEKFKFNKIHLKRSFYSNGKDALIMTREQ